MIIFSKRLSTLLVIALFSAAMLFLFSACDMFDFLNQNEKPKKKTEEFPAAQRKLTIDGLDSFNDKYVYVQCQAGGNLLVGLTDITGYPKDVAYQLVKISGGEAKIPLYYKNPSGKSYSNSYIAYEGNDTLSSSSQLTIIILSDSSLKLSDATNALTNNINIKKVSSGIFSDGNMILDWESCDFNYDHFIYESNADNTFYSISGYKGNGGSLFLPSLYLNKPIYAIGIGAFKDKGITHVAIPDSIVSIAEDSFAQNPNLSSINIGSKVAFYSDIDSSKTTFDGNFETVYRTHYKTKGVYTRIAGSDNWTKE